MHSSVKLICLVAVALAAVEVTQAVSPFGGGPAWDLQQLQEWHELANQLMHDSSSSGDSSSASDESYWDLPDTNDSVDRQNDVPGLSDFIKKNYLLGVLHSGKHGVGFNTPGDHDYIHAGHKQAGLSSGASVGIAIAVIASVAIAAAVIVIVIYRNRSFMGLTQTV